MTPGYGARAAHPLVRGRAALVAVLRASVADLLGGLLGGLLGRAGRGAGARGGVLRRLLRGVRALAGGRGGALRGGTGAAGALRDDLLSLLHRGLEGLLDGCGGLAGLTAPDGHGAAGGGGRVVDGLAGGGDGGAGAGQRGLALLDQLLRRLLPAHALDELLAALGEAGVAGLDLAGDLERPGDGERRGLLDGGRHVLHGLDDLRLHALRVEADLVGGDGLADLGLRDLETLAQLDLVGGQRVPEAGLDLLGTRGGGRGGGADALDDDVGGAHDGQHGRRLGDALADLRDAGHGNSFCGHRASDAVSDSAGTTGGVGGAAPFSSRALFGPESG